MNRCKRAAALLWLAVLGVGLTACTKYKPVPPPDVKLNASPKVRYEVTITMGEAPASVRSFIERVQYTIVNYLKCVPVDYTRSLGGSHPKFEKYAEIEFRRVEANTFKAELVYDLLLNEDYYSLGVCRWQPAIVSTKLDRPQSRFSRMNIALPEALSAEYKQERFCLKPEHIRNDMLGSCTSLESMQAGKEPQDWYFKVVTQITRK